MQKPKKNIQDRDSLQEWMKLKGIKTPKDIYGYMGEFILRCSDVKGECMNENVFEVKFECRNCGYKWTQGYPQQTEISNNYSCAQRTDVGKYKTNLHKLADAARGRGNTECIICPNCKIYSTWAMEYKPILPREKGKQGGVGA